MKNIEPILQELVDVNLPPIEAQQVQHIIKRAFMAGKAEQADPLAGYSSLTEAIKAGGRIDYEKLDGMKMQCVHSEMGTLHRTLKRDTLCPPGVPAAWLDGDKGRAYSYALVDAWRGENGWSLWVEGDIPMRRKTANQLKVGTYFRGRVNNHVVEETVYVGRAANVDGKIICFSPSMVASQYGAEDWEVLEEYGPFQKPEGE